MRKAAILTVAAVCCGFTACSVPSIPKVKLPSLKRQPAAEQPQTSAADQLLAEATALSTAGKHAKAAKVYKKYSTLYPLSAKAPEAAYLSALSFEKDGKLIKSFDAYQEFISKHYASGRYSTALKRQEAVALAAATGDIKNTFLGLKSNISPRKTTKMLEQVRDNAPHASSAPRAQFAIGSLWKNHGNATKAIAGYQEVQARYPESKLTPEALYQIGRILMDQANSGNRNQANLNRARNTFLDLTQLHPNHKRSKEARQLIKSIAAKDVQRSFEVAEFYDKKGKTESAIFYYREVLRQSKGGTLHNKAKKRLAELKR